MFDRLRGVPTYADERQRLLELIKTLDPHTTEYKTVLDRIEQLDKITKRSGEKIKAFIPACVTAVSLVGIYAAQQFAGIVVPKALDAIASRSNKEHPTKED